MPALLLVLLLVVGGCSSLKLGPSVLNNEPVWTTEGETPQRRHATEQAVPPPLEEAWSFNAGAGFGPGSPLIWGNVVLVANRKGEVIAIDLETGKGLGEEEFGDAVEGTPVLQGTVLYTPVAWGGTILAAYDLVRGQGLWRMKGVPIEAGLLYLDGTIVAVDVQGTAWGYHAESGAVRWQDSLGVRVAVKATPVAAGPGTFIVADDQGNVSALAVADGAMQWQQTLGAPVYNTPAAGEALVFVPTTRGRFYALDAASGRVRWQYALPDATVRFTSPALSGTELVFGGSDGIVRMLDARTGEVAWTFEARDALAAAPLLSEGVVYVGSMGRMLYALDRRTGALQWEQTLEGRIKSAMAAGGGGLVVLSEPRAVYFFKPASEADYAATR